MLLYKTGLMKEEEIEPRQPRAQTIKPQEEKPSTSTESKLQRVNPEPQVNPMTDPSKIREENQTIFHAAHGERKAMNLQRMRDYMQKRVESFQERSRICETITAMFFEKQKNTKAFLKNVIRYFEDYVDLYASLHKSIGKLELKKKYQNSTMYTALKQSIAELVKLNDDESEHIQNFVDWLSKILIQAFKSAYNFFKDRLKKLNKDVQSSDSNYSSCWSKQEKAFEKLTDGNDLLEKQLILMEHIKNTNEAAINRAVELYQAWGSLLQQQNTIKRLLRDNILQFHDRFVKFHKKTDSSTAIFRYWSNLPASATTLTVFGSFLDQKSVQYINFGSRSPKLGENFENYMRLVHEEKRVGNPYPFLDILIVKKFNSKLQLSQREWKDVKLIFSVDKNLLLLDEKEGKIILKLKQSSVKLKRVSENILELNGVQQGVIFDSKKKESIHFETLDEVQQFIYYVNSIPEKKQDEK